ncbi:PREDICTED: gastrula zinc finger protein XlCGF9.1-like, partial [Apaloderma vittatum]|uniref:gastrula zinc finger protein XlCGF9.1-like n=1 Tax=Apaloderma vittatum TaxID=57397 RepID=UPI0005215CD0
GVPLGGCQNIFKWKRNLMRHQWIYTGEKPFKCLECGQRLTRSTHLLQHGLTQTKKKPFPCTTCWKCFARHSYLIDQQHLHAGEKLFSCPCFKKTFQMSSHLIRHQQFHHNGTHTKKKPFPCTTCGKWFTRTWVLVNQKHIHTEEKPFVCPDCEKNFSQNCHLQRHLQALHKGESSLQGAL